MLIHTTLLEDVSNVALSKLEEHFHASTPMLSEFVIVVNIEEPPVGEALLVPVLGPPLPAEPLANLATGANWGVGLARGCRDRGTPIALALGDGSGILVALGVVLRGDIYRLALEVDGGRGFILLGGELRGRGGRGGRGMVG